MNTNNTQPSLGPDLAFEKFNEHSNQLSPYRTPAPPIVYKQPIDLGPAKRTGKLLLVAIPFVAPFALIPFISPLSIIEHLFIQVCVVCITVKVIRATATTKLSDMSVALKSSWWPITLIALLVRIIIETQVLVYPYFIVRRLFHYIKTGE